MEANNPVLSIAVLTYAHSKYIRQALDSVFMQKLNVSFEIVIADDMSPDNTREVINEYIEQHPDLNIRTLYQEKNVGMWQNVFDLLNALRGDYFAFIEGDDYWIDDNKLQQQLDFLMANPDHVCSFHTAKVIKEADSNNKLTFKRYPAKPVPETTGLEDLLFEGNYVPTASMVQRNVFRGNYPACMADKRVHPDVMLHFIQAAHGKYHYQDKEMSVYRINTSGVTENLTRIVELEAMVFMIERSDKLTERKWHDLHRKATQKWYYWLLNLYREAGDKVQIKKYLSLIEQNKQFDGQYHPNFIRKVWVEEFLPGGKTLLKLLGK